MMSMMIKINTDVNNKKMKIDIVKSEIKSSDIKIFIQDSNGLFTSYFHHMIKTYIW